ncbi:MULTISPECIES: agmatinase [Chelatococcus]|uniref:Agmatinase n=1 Tax=Chelatococcus caeni TaxID=1348468 RepID=A0A840C7Z9_9HYPH|nr:MULTISPECIES: agmatinase [Chelatococcus]ALA20414.1 arginase [Chelatococcus sp. CO-6]MBB4018457.1 agmatinase [Chelatococcus caeni]
MALPLTVPPTTKHQSFLWSPISTDLDALDAHVAILGIPFGSAYEATAITNDQTRAPDAVRAATDRVCRGLERYDFDVGGPIYGGRALKVVDVGNVPADMTDLASHYRRAEEAVRKILAAGAMPVTIGGDHGIPIPILRAFEGRGPITLVQVDAHIDWRDHVNGVRDGLSSPIRRASEMSHIGEIFQIGIRSQGSARPEEVEAAAAYGANIISAYEVHDGGMEAVLARIPDGGQYYITIDADGLDPSIMPAVEGPAPGGLTFHQVRKLIHGLVAKGRVLGMDIVEITPSSDVNMISAITAGRLIVNLIGAAVRANYFDAPPA